MEKRKYSLSRLYVLILTFFIMTVLTACLPPNYTKEEAKAVTDKGKEMLTEYVSGTYGTKLSQSVEIVEGTKTVYDDYSNNNTQGRYLSMLAKSAFKVDGQEYVIYINTENGDVYTDFYAEEIDKAATQIISDVLMDCGVSCKMVAQNTVYAYTVKTGGDDEVLATIRDAYPADVNADNAKEYLLNALEADEANINIDLNCAGDVGFFTPDVWRKLMASYSGINRVEATNYPDSYINEMISTGVKTISADMWVIETYSLWRDSYSQQVYEVINQGDVYVNTVSDEYSIKPSDDGETESSKSYNCQLNVDGNSIYVLTDHRFVNRIFFKGDQYKKKKADVQYAFSQKPTRHKIMECGEGYYTIETGLEPRIFSFMEDLTIELK